MQREATPKRFLPTTHKISYVSAHPVQPWLAIVDKNSGGQIWNWQTGEILFTAQFGGIDESAMHYHSLQKMAEVDPAYWGAKTSQDQSVSKTPSGKLKMIEFMDVETLYWNRVAQLSIIKSRSADETHGDVPGSVAVKGERWLIFVCENKILFHELLSHKSHELTKIALDSKNPTCIAVLSGMASNSSLHDTFIAIGCNDGTIRLISFSSFKTVVKLGYKSPPVTCLKALHTCASTTLLVSGSQEGNLCLWDPFPNVAAFGTSLPPISTVSKAHDGEVVSIALGFSTPISGTAAIFTLGGDRSIAIYEIQGLKNLSKFRGPNQKTPFHSMDICQFLGAIPERCPVLVSSQTMVQATTVAGGNYTKIFDPTAAMLPTFKKAPKIYHFFLHPLQRHWAVLALNAGVMMVKLTVPYFSTTVSLPIPKTPKQSLELTCLRLRGQSLLQTELMMVQQESSGGNSVRSVPETIMDREILEISDIFGTGGHYELELSPDSSKLAIVRTDANRFIILTNTGTLTWTDGFEGQGSSLVWNATSNKVAVMDILPPITAIASQKALGRVRSRTDSSQSFSNETPSPPTVKIFSVGSANTAELNTGGNAPDMLHGGPLLGVTFGMQPGSSSRTFLFYSWETLQPCSDELEAPEWVAWSSSFDLCALAYETHILLCQATDRFRPMTALPVKDGTGGKWKGDLLYVSTHSSVECIVVQRSSQSYNVNTILSIQAITLASFKSGPNWLTGSVENEGGTQKPRPTGHLRILNAAREKVWVVDTDDRTSMIDINYPGFLALVNAVNGQYSAARDAAMGKLSSDSLGQMFLTMGKRSAVEALKLPGLSLPLRLKTAIEARYLKHALLCFQAIASGCRRPEAVVRLPEFRETLKEKLPTPKKSPVATGVSRSPFSIGDAPATAPASLLPAISGESIDWEIPLRVYTQKPRKKLNLEVSREVLQLGIALHDAAVDERMYDVADTAASLIIQHCDEVQNGDLMIQLETRLSAREQTSRLKELIDLSDKAKKSCNGQLRGLTAAVLSGDRLSLSEALRDLNMS